MSSPTAYGAYAGGGFLLELAIKVVESGGPSMEAFYHGMFGALGALVVKVGYDLIVKAIQQYKQHVRKREVE